MTSPTPAKSASMPFLSLSSPSSSSSSSCATPITKLGGKLGGFLTLSADAMSRAKNRKAQKMMTLQDKQRRRSSIMDAVDDIELVSSTSGSDLHDIGGETPAEIDLNPSLESKSKSRTSPSSRSNARRYGRRGSCTAYTVEKNTNDEECQPSSFRNLLDHPGSKKNKPKQKQSQAQVPSRRSKKSTLQSPATTLPLTIDDRPIPLKQPPHSHSKGGSALTSPVLLGKPPKSPGALRLWKLPYASSEPPSSPNSILS
jgi:hypothetical protein